MQLWSESAKKPQSKGEMSVCRALLQKFYFTKRNNIVYNLSEEKTKSAIKVERTNVRESCAKVVACTDTNKQM